MGQTLTHGVYLPDEGERNCYAGLASNWSLLDGAVGTIAEHTTQIAGKAPAVHTHTKSDITDFPAYGNAAGTICEGNDSRLSDARTPVAHTHTKSDVTDLFNSANTWTGDNTFSGSNSFNSGLTINNAALLNAVLQNAVKGDVSTTGDFGIFIKDKVNGNAATSLLAVYRGGQDSGGSYAQVNIDTKGNDNNRYNNSILFKINPADNNNNAILIPQRDKTIDLGTSLNQWKTLNGVNPGALSLPKIVAKATADISSAIVGTDGETQYLDGTDNNYTAALDGWISMCIGGFTQSNELWITVYDQQNETWGTSAESSTSARNNLFIIFPIRANQKMRIRMRCNSVIYARFYPCEGNV